MSDTPAPITLVPLPDIPAVEAGDDLAALISAAAARAGVALENGVLVVCQKIISKSEGRLVPLANVEPSEEAKRIAHFQADRVGPHPSAYIVWPFAEFEDRDQRIIGAMERAGTRTVVYNFTQFRTFPRMREFAPELFDYLV